MCNHFYFTLIIYVGHGLRFSEISEVTVCNHIYFTSKAYNIMFFTYQLSVLRQSVGEETAKITVRMWLQCSLERHSLPTRFVFAKQKIYK